MASQKQTRYETEPYYQWEEAAETAQHYHEQFGVSLQPRDSFLRNQMKRSPQEFLVAAGVFLAFVLFVIKR